MARTIALIVLVAVAAAAFASLASGFAGPGDGAVVVTGSGSSFIAPQMYAWSEQVRRATGWVVVEYESVGSGAGLSNFLSGVKDFAASDPPLPRSKWEELRGRVLQVPAVLGAVVVVYNIPGLRVTLNLTGEVLARIYMGEIEYWDDPAIASLNPTVKLPHERIIAVYRSDSSGTTQVFTLYLHKSAPDVWPEELVGKTIDWPVAATGRGVGAKGNEGVSRVVASTPYSIGYVELSYALYAGLPLAALENGAGEFVIPTTESLAAAATAAGLPASPLDDFSSVPEAMVYPGVPGAYPVASFSFLILWASYDDPDKARALAAFLEYIAGPGQESLAPGYFPVPEEARRLALEAAEILAGGSGSG